MANRIFLYTKGKTDPILSSESLVVVGRDEACDVQFDFDAVSRKHFELSTIKNDWFIKDLGSTNGTLINKVKIAPNKLILIRDSDILLVGAVNCLVKESNRVKSDPMLHVFNRDRYEGSFSVGLATTFSVGGPAATISVSNDQSVDIIFYVKLIDSSLKLFVKQSGPILNGSAVNESIIVSDKDEIEIDQIRIIVSQGKEILKSKNDSLENDNSEIVEMPDYLKERISGDSWDDPLTLKLRNKNQKSVDLGSFREDNSNLDQADMFYQTGELGSSRFSRSSLGAISSLEDEQNKKYAILGVVTLIILTMMFLILIYLFV